MNRRGLILGLLAAPIAVAATKVAAAATGGTASAPMTFVGETPCQFLVPADFERQIRRSMATMIRQHELLRV